MRARIKLSYRPPFRPRSSPDPWRGAGRAEGTNPITRRSEAFLMPRPNDWFVECARVRVSGIPYHRRQASQKYSTAASEFDA